jgi:hypothetical protein
MPLPEADTRAKLVDPVRPRLDPYAALMRGKETAGDGIQ